jgi:acyl carrier protein
MRVLSRQTGDRACSLTHNKKNRRCPEKIKTGVPMDELFIKMQKMIAEKLEIDEAKITLDSSFRQDLGADSLDTYELVYAIEEELAVKIPDEKANEFETVRDAYEFIKSQQK